MTQKIIAVVNQKGGVGKTTTAIDVAAELASLFNVLLVDLDPQGNATGGLGHVKDKTRGSIYSVISGRSKVSDVAQATNIKNLYLIPGSANLSGAELELVNMNRREYMLKDALENIKFNVIIIDCPPSLGLLTINALTASTHVLIPVQTEYYALEGLSQLLKTIQAVKGSTNPDLEFLGIVMTMYDKRTTLSSQVREEVEKYFGDLVFKTNIPRNIRLAEAPSYGKTIFEYDKRSKGAKAYKHLSKEVAEKLNNA